MYFYTILIKYCTFTECTIVWIRTFFVVPLQILKIMYRSLTSIQYEENIGKPVDQLSSVLKEINVTPLFIQTVETWRQWLNIELFRCQLVLGRRGWREYSTPALEITGWLIFYHLRSKIVHFTVNDWKRSNKPRFQVLLKVVVSTLWVV